MTAINESDWFPIPGWEGAYEASMHGAIRSLDRITTKGQRIKGQILAPNVMPNGYHMISMWKASKRTARTVHRLVMEAISGPCPDGHEVCHRNGNRDDNRWMNLYYGTRSENNLDKVKHGTDHNASKTHCKHGHEFNSDNTRWRPGGGRACRRCQANRQTRRRQARAAV